MRATELFKTNNSLVYKEHEYFCAVMSNYCRLCCLKGQQMGTHYKVMVVGIKQKIPDELPNKDLWYSNVMLMTIASGAIIDQNAPKWKSCRLP